MKALFLFVFIFLLQICSYCQKNIATQAQLLESKNISNAEFLIDGKETATKDCKYSFGYFVIDLKEIHKLHNIEIIFKSGNGCDNFVKELKVYATANGKFELIKTFGESHFTKTLNFETNKEAKLLKFEIHSLEDCMENEFLCIEEAKVMAK